MDLDRQARIGHVLHPDIGDLGIGENAAQTVPDHFLAAFGGLVFHFLARIVGFLAGEGFIGIAFERTFRGKFQTGINGRTANGSARRSGFR